MFELLFYLTNSSRTWASLEMLWADFPSALRSVVYVVIISQLVPDWSELIIRGTRVFISPLDDTNLYKQD